jgi:hypothetical protein
MNPPAKRSGVLRRLLRCGCCGNVLTPQPDELLQFTQKGWPKCCGQVMTLYTETAPDAASDDTKVDRPPLT